MCVQLSALVGFALNPFQTLQVLLQSGGQIVIVLRQLRAGPPVAVPLHLPFRGVWLVARGGLDRETSHSWTVIGQRFAYDFVCVDTQKRTHAGDGRRLEDYYAFGAPVLSPCDGEVIRIRNGIRDFPKPGTGCLDMWTRDIRGNFVLVRREGGGFVLLGHLRQYSIQVRATERVRQGQPIGTCGNSGHSTEPHLHLQVQDTASFYTGIPVPLTIADVVLRRGYLISSDGADPGAMPCASVEAMRMARGDLWRSIWMLLANSVSAVLIWWGWLTLARKLLKLGGSG